MPKQALKELEREKGGLERIIPPLVNDVGVVAAARKLNISAATVGKWLKDNGYISHVWWLKDATPEEHEDIEAAHDRVNAKRRAEGRPTLEEEEQAS